MKIIVLAGSPKGVVSVTMQYVEYLKKVNPACEFIVYPVAQKIAHIEKDEQYFYEIIEAVEGADGVLWAFPLYFLMTHAHYKRFIEIVFERSATAAFHGKYAATLSTSIHYFDHTAHNYMQAVCDDLGMRFVGSFSADMSDLMQEKGQRQLEQFGQVFLRAIQAHAATQRQYAPLRPPEFVYTPGETTGKTDTRGKKIAIIHDGERRGSNLAAMVQRCRAAFQQEVTVVDLNEVDIRSSCLGCLRCGYDNHCAFEGKDGFIDFFRSAVMGSDVLVFAGSMVDRYLSSRWKTFFDRSFFNTHTPSLVDKQLVFVVSGALNQEPNLRQILQGYAEFQGAHIVGFISDQSVSSQELDNLIDQTMSEALRRSVVGYSSPQTFLGVAGMKLFRDDIWGRLRFVFRADHLAFRRMGFYKTFPQRDIRNRLLLALMMPLLNFKWFRQGFFQHIEEQMVSSYKKVL